MDYLTQDEMIAALRAWVDQYAGRKHFADAVGISVSGVGGYLRGENPVPRWMLMEMGLVKQVVYFKKETE